MCHRKVWYQRSAMPCTHVDEVSTPGGMAGDLSV